uniref:Putative secreted protein n=1 Tax=Ixodes ricinus TaxID=34613 RepID=A0A6B0UV96_IXORI
MALLCLLARCASARLTRRVFGDMHRLLEDLTMIVDLAARLFARLAAFFRSLNSSAVYWRGRPDFATAEVTAADDIDASGAAMFLDAERSRSGRSASRECDNAPRRPPWLPRCCGSLLTVAPLGEAVAGMRSSVRRWECEDQCGSWTV